MSITRSAIILAAGRGSRLGDLATELPKCLVLAGGTSLIERQLGCLRTLGVDQITVVVGFNASAVREVCGSGIEYIYNERYAETNSLFSLWLARASMLEGALVMNADVLFHPQLLSDLLTAQHEDALLISYQDANQPPLGDEEMKVIVRQGRILSITKSIEPVEADGENVGIARFSRSGARVLIEKMNALIEQGRLRDWAPRAFQDFALARPLYAVATRGYPWIEIDFPEDYLRAVNEILPLIEAAEPTFEQLPVSLGCGLRSAVARANPGVDDALVKSRETKRVIADL